MVELLSAIQQRMAEPMTMVIVINGVTLTGMISLMRKLGRMEKMFDLMWADFVKRKRLE